MAKILQCIKEVLNKQKLKTIGSIDWGSVKRYREKPKKSLIEVEGIKKVLRGIKTTIKQVLRNIRT